MRRTVTRLPENRGVLRQRRESILHLAGASRHVFAEFVHPEPQDGPAGRADGKVAPKVLCFASALSVPVETLTIDLNIKAGVTESQVQAAARQPVLREGGEADGHWPATPA